MEQAVVKTGKQKSKIVKLLFDLTFWRGVIAIIVFLVLWEIGAQAKNWFGFMVPFVGKLAPPTDVMVRWVEVAGWPGYWESWYLSTGRVFLGFIVAQVIGIPFGLAMAVNKYFRGMFFPPFEILRPIPPLAWVPASIIFWPTTELSIASSTVHGSVPVGSFLQNNPAWHFAINICWCSGWDGHHLGGGAGRGDDIRRWAARWWWPGFLYLEFIYGRGNGPGNSWHDQHWFGRIHFE